MSDTKACPFCAEEIKAAALKCKHCGEFLESCPPRGPNLPQTEVASDPGTPGQTESQAYGFLMWVGLSAFLYGTYTCIGVNETRVTMGQYGNSSVLDAMGDRGLLWIGIGIFILLIGAAAKSAGKKEIDLDGVDLRPAILVEGRELIGELTPNQWAVAFIIVALTVAGWLLFSTG